MFKGRHRRMTKKMRLTAEERQALYLVTGVLVNPQPIVQEIEATALMYKNNLRALQGLPPIEKESQ